MVFTSVEIFALIFAALVIIKLAVVSVKPMAWWKIVKPLYKNGTVLFLVELVLAGIVLFYLMQSGLSITQIVAVILLGALLTGMSFAIYSKETSSWAGSLLKTKNLMKKAWLVMIIWLALAVWVLLEIFAVI